MYPALRSGELLHVEPYGLKQVRRGDVIVFNPEGKETFVIHRVISTTHGEIRTRGDNNRKIDPWVISGDKIIGRVISARKGNHQRRITGGFQGHLEAILLRVKRRSKLHMKEVFHPFYLFFADRGILKKIFPLQKRLRIIAVKRREGTEQKLLLGRYEIGVCRPQSDQWQIRQPFRLFVDENALLATRSADITPSSRNTAQ